MRTAIRPSRVASCSAVTPATMVTKTIGTISILMALMKSRPTGSSAAPKASSPAALNAAPSTTPMTSAPMIRFHRVIASQRRHMCRLLPFRATGAIGRFPPL